MSIHQYSSQLPKILIIRIHRTVFELTEFFPQSVCGVAGCGVGARAAGKIVNQSSLRFRQLKNHSFWWLNRNPFPYCHLHFQSPSHSGWSRTINCQEGTIPFVWEPSRHRHRFAHCGMQDSNVLLRTRGRRRYQDTIPVICSALANQGI